MAKNNEAKKYYLSPAAIARLRAESARSAYPMSVIIDMLILKHLPPADMKPAVIAPFAPERNVEGLEELEAAAANKIRGSLRVPDALLTPPTVQERSAHRALERAAAESREATRHQEAPVVPSKERFKIDL